MDTLQVNVCGKYPLQILAPNPDEELTKDSYYRYFSNAEKNSRCFEYLLEPIPEGISVIEHFGGMGMTGVMIDAVLEPSMHRLFEIDPYCLRQLKHVFGESAQYGDAKTLMGTIYADLITLDFPSFNANHEKEWNLEGVFKLGPRFVTIADIAQQRIGLHRDLWSKMFNRKIVTNQDYIQALSDKWYVEYHYAVRRVGYHKHSFMLLTPGPPSTIEFWKLGDKKEDVDGKEEKDNKEEISQEER